MRLLCCSINDMTGEGNFANYYLQTLALNKIFVYDGYFIYLYINGRFNKIRKFNFIHEKFNAYQVNFKLLLIYIKNRNKFDGWINYAPLWNPILFFFIRKDSILGPITGSKYFHVCDYNIYEKISRKYFIPFLYHVSSLIISYRGLKVNSGNFYVQDFLQNYSINTCDFLMSYIKSLVKNDVIDFVNREFDIIFYNSHHKNKLSCVTFNICSAILKINPKLKIVCYGDKPINYDNNIVYLGRINTPLLFKYFSSSKNFITNSREVAGLSPVEAENLGCKVFCISDTGPSYYCRSPLVFSSDELMLKYLTTNF